jgi:hypothetical protein
MVWTIRPFTSRHALVLTDFLSQYIFVCGCEIGRLDGATPGRVCDDCWALVILTRESANAVISSDM